MKGRSSVNLKRLIISLLLLLGITGSIFSFQKEIEGKINVYKKVLSIGTDNVIVNSIDSIAPGDTILLIQMQGIEIVTDDNGYGSAPQELLGVPGGYEFLLVLSIDVPQKKIVFTSNLLNTFDIRGNVQLIRVPFYNAATVKGNLTAKSWSPADQTGGVLALIVGGKLRMDSEINVSGKGFFGGKDTIGAGACLGITGIQTYPQSYHNAGYKGEGLAIHDASGILLLPTHAKGSGPNLTGGGGGNGKYSGGGGGSNRGIGAFGGSEKLDCFPDIGDGGIGGITIKSYPSTSNGIFFGGGGGASTHASGSVGSSGGNGGGIVIIIADTISGNHNYIRADGAASGNATSDAGAGGGGGGGSIILSLQSFSSILSDTLKISAVGGNGGINPGGFGYGGGGGGGLLWSSTNTIPDKISVKVNYGIHVDNPLSTAGNGEIKFNFTPKLNGFLFNSIRSAVTGDQIDSICSNVPLGMITGTNPVGGTPGYTYLWESSTTSETTGFSTAAGTNNLPDYSPGLVTQTTWFRRVVTDAGVPALTDFSKPVKIIVHQAITGNLIGKDTVICYNQDPLKLVPLNSGPGAGNGKYSYSWIQNITDAGWTSSPPADGLNSKADYDPTALSDTKYYKRVVTSGRCIDYSATVKITVLPTIKSNTITTPAQVICYGDQFINIGATVKPLLNGGDDLFKYKWIRSTDGSSWLPAEGIYDSTYYNPIESSLYFPGREYFKRVVISGFKDCCIDTSTSVLLTSHPKITNNIISAGQTICSGSILPVNLTGTQPSAGDGVNYNYIWQDSSKVHNWSAISGATLRDFQPPVLIDTTLYRRIVLSSACDDTSNVIVVKVHKPVVNNIISLLSGTGTDTTICNGAIPNRILGLIPTGGTNNPPDNLFGWFYSTDNVTWNPVPVAGTGINYQPGPLTVTTYFRRKVTSGECWTESGAVRIIVLPLISNNIISPDQIICYNTVPVLLTGLTLSGGAGPGSYNILWEQSTDGTTWVPAAGTNNNNDYQPPALAITMKYKRMVKSGINDCCSSESNIHTVGINPLPSGRITTITDTTICEGSQIPLQIHLTGASKWRVVYQENSSRITLNNNVQVSDTTIMVKPTSSLSLNTFNYSLFSVQDKNGCFATSLTGTRKADVYKVPKAVAGNDSVICGPEYTLSATPSVGTGIWYYPPEVVYTSANGPVMTVKIDSSFNSLNVRYKFIWKEVNWNCSDKDSLLITFDRRVKSVYAGPDKVLYSFDHITQVDADVVKPGETGKWSVISGTGDFADDSVDSTEVRNVSKGANEYLWTVTNGTCLQKDTVTITVYDLKIPEGFSPNNDPDNYNNTFIVSGLDLRKKWDQQLQDSVYLQIAELTIVNSAGAQVFSTTNRDDNTFANWDGKNSKGSDFPEGTYYYLLKITSNGNGQVFKKSGFIILKRY